MGASCCTCRGGDGFEIIDRFFSEVSQWLAPGGAVFMEIGKGQHTEVERRCDQVAALEVVGTHLDLAGIPRVFEARRTALS